VAVHGSGKKTKQQQNGAPIVNIWHFITFLLNIYVISIFKKIELITQIFQKFSASHKKKKIHNSFSFVNKTLGQINFFNIFSFKKYHSLISLAETK
jgi:hypothetical protein